MASQPRFPARLGRVWLAITTEGSEAGTDDMALAHLATVGLPAALTVPASGLAIPMCAGCSGWRATCRTTAQGERRTLPARAGS